VPLLLVSVSVASAFLWRTPAVVQAVVVMLPVNEN